MLIRGRVPRPPPESDPPGVTPAGAVNHMTHELFFDWWRVVDNNNSNSSKESTAVVKVVIFLVKT